MNKAWAYYLAFVTLCAGFLLGFAASYQEPAAPAPQLSLSDQLKGVFYQTEPVRYIVNITDGEVHVVGDICPAQGHVPLSADEFRRIERSLQRVIDRNEADRQVPVFGRDSETNSESGREH